MQRYHFQKWVHEVLSRTLFLTVERGYLQPYGPIIGRILWYEMWKWSHMHLCHLASSLVTKSERHTALLSEFDWFVLFGQICVSEKKLC